LRITGTRTTAPTFNENTIFDTASLRRGPLTPGELVWLFGTALGPTNSVSAQFDQQGRLPTELGGVTVSFDGINAPINFAGFNAVQVQVPNELADRNQTNIILRFQGVSSPTVTASLVAASPGLYTAGGSGTGPLNAVNANGTLYTPDNRATRGSFVTVFANGLGPTNPLVPTGQRAASNPLSGATLPITASIGGQPAQVTYAGLTPGYVGLFQLNITVPANASPGARVPLSITINGVPSQEGATIAVQQ
jgi:uncharacterized protein (TIGR03437 family)